MVTYQLDNMTYIETESLVSFRGHSTVWVGLGALSRLEKAMQYFIAYKLPACRMFSFLAVQNASSL